MVLGLWFESARAMFFLFILLNALPVPMLRQVHFLVFFSFFYSSFSDGSFLSFCHFLTVFGGPKGGNVGHILKKNEVSGEKGEPLFLHTLTVFWLVFECLGLPGGRKKQEKTPSKQSLFF